MLVALVIVELATTIAEGVKFSIFKLVIVAFVNDAFCAK